MSNRTKLEKKAKDLGVEFDPEITEENLRQLVTEAEASNEADLAEQNAANEAEEPEEVFAEGTKFYKSKIAGLQIQFGEEPDRTEQPNHVRFQPYNFRDEAKGEDYQIGFLATDEQDVQEVLVDDANVEEISEDEYREETSQGKKARL